MAKFLEPTPWDAQVFGFPTYELKSLHADALAEAASVAGHVTVKVPPEFRIDPLVAHGFYYCDTLINPFCSAEKLKPVHDSRVTIDLESDRDVLAELSQKAFTFGRFHRDFNIPREQADLRYARWFMQLAEQGAVYTLRYERECAGFFGFTGNRIVLHALDERFRGKGLAKYFWSEACVRLFQNGHAEIVSSVSADNMAIVNLYASLGFRFRNPLLCYHHFRKP